MLQILISESMIYMLNTCKSLTKQSLKYKKNISSSHDQVCNKNIQVNINSSEKKNAFSIVSNNGTRNITLTCISK